MTVVLPNFFVVGVPKAGTTSLYHYLNQHPQVYMSPVKEPAFFGAADYATGRYAIGAEVVLDWEEYLDLFRGVRDEIAIGEASVGYFALPGAAGAIRSRVPAAKLIVVLRDVADRLLTVYAGTGWQTPEWTFREWFREAVAGGAGARDLGRFVDGGRYATHLQRFFALFPRDQIRIHLYEDYRRDAAAVLRSLFTFLEVDADVAIDVSRRHNETVMPRFPRLHALRRAVFGSRPAPGWLPPGARRLVRRLYHRGRSGLVMDAEDRRLVIDYYRDEIMRTAELIGRDLSSWLAP